MKKKTIIITIIISLIITFLLVTFPGWSALLNRFNEDSSEVTIIFSNGAGSNNSTYLKIPNGSNVSTATFNITGSTNRIFWDEYNQPGANGAFACPVQADFNDLVARDSNLTTQGQCWGNVNTWANFTAYQNFTNYTGILSTVTEIEIKARMRVYGASGVDNFTTTVSYYNYTSASWITPYTETQNNAGSGEPTQNLSLMNLTISSDIWTAGNNLQLRFIGNTSKFSSSSGWYIFEIYQVMIETPSNVSVNIGQDADLEYNGTGYLTTEVELSDFAEELTNHTTNCNCSGCELSGIYCKVPINISSNSSGILTLSALNLVYDFFRPYAENVTLNKDVFVPGDTATITYDYVDTGGTTEDTNLTLYEWYIDGVAQSGRKVYWNFNKNITPTENALNITLNNGTVNGSTWTSGVYGGAYSYDGVNDYIEIADYTNDLNLTGSFAISTWIYPDLGAGEGAGDYHTIFGKEDSGGGGYSVAILNDDVRINFNGDTHMTTGTALTNQSWQQVLVVFDDAEDELLVYVNGSHYETFDETGTMSYADEQKPRIGLRYDDTKPFKGVIDEVKLFNTSLSSAEATDLFNNEYMKDFVIPSSITNEATIQGAVMVFDNEVGDEVFITSNSGEVWADAVLTDCSAGNATALFFDFGIEPLFTTTTGVNFDVRVNYTTAISSKGASFNFTNADNASICLYGKNLTIDLLVGEYNKTDYSGREFYLIDKALDNTTQNYTLYSLLDNTSSGVDVEVQDELQIKIEEALIIVQRFDYVNDVWRTVTWMYTGSTGTDHTYLEPYTVLYQFLVYKNGVLLKQFDPIKIVSDDLILRIAETTPSYVEYLETVTSSCSFDNSTKKLSCSVADSADQLSNTCLTIYENMTVNSTYYSGCVAGNNGTLIVQLNNTETVRYDYLLEGTFPTMNHVLERGIIDYVRNTNFGSLGLIGTAMIVITGAMMGLPPPALVIAMGVLALWGASVMGLLSVTQTTIFGVVLVGAILIWVMKR